MKDGKRMLAVFLKYGALWPIIFTVTPFLVSLLMILSFTLGNSTNAAYLISHAGIINIWFQGLTVILTVFIQYLFPFAFLKSLWGIKKHPVLNSIIALVLFIMTAVLTPIFVIPFVVALFAVSTYLDHLTNKRDSKSRQNDDLKKLSVEEIKKNITELEHNLKLSGERLVLLAVLFGLSLSLLVFTVYPSVLPNSVLTFRDNQIVQGRVVSDNGHEILLIDKESSKLKLFQVENLQKHEVCSSSNPHWLIGSILANITNTQRIDSCR